jgi:hypothetical protein
MKGTGIQVLFCCAVVTVSLIATSCSTAPEGPKIGTPAFYWSAAKQTFAAGDYLRANDNLAQVTKSDNEFTARALPWRLVVASGLAQGFMDLAENFELGAHANRNNPTPFRRQVNMYRTQASQLALQFAESLQKFEATKDPNVTLAFPYPSGSLSMPTQLKRVTSGILVQQSDIDDLEKHLLAKGVLLAACRAVGAPEDTAKAQHTLKGETTQVPRDVFTLALANTLYEQSQLFTRDRLDRPDRLQMFCNEALEILQGLKENKEAKALAAKIQKSLKKLKG